MGESYVRPVTSATEPPPRWLPVWRFRLAALVVLAVFGYATALGIQVFVQGANRQDPGVDDTVGDDPVVPTPAPAATPTDLPGG